MERKKHLLTALLLLISLSFFGQNGQNNQNSRSIYQAYINGDMESWLQVIVQADKQPEKTESDILELINYQYGYIAWCLGQKLTDQAKQYLKQAQKNIDILEKKEYNMSSLYAYKAAFIGYEIGLSPVKAPFMGPKSLDYAEKAISSDPLNPLTYSQLGNITYYTPKLFGGSQIQALNHYLMALSLMESNPKQLPGNWNYLNLLATIINAYIDLEQYSSAHDYCIKTLRLEPDFKWVKNELLPLIRNKLNQ